MEESVAEGSVVGGGVGEEHSSSSWLTASGCASLAGEVAAADTRCKVAFTNYVVLNSYRRVRLDSGTTGGSESGVRSG